MRREYATAPIDLQGGGRSRNAPPPNRVGVVQPLDVGGEMSQLHRVWKGAELAIERIYHGYSIHRYEVTLVAGVWPTDDELLSLCDGNTPPARFDFGGNVEKFANSKARVEVYVD